MLYRLLLICLAILYAPSLTVARAGTLVQMGTSIGTILIELYDSDKPITTANFLRYVNNGSYNDAFFHRLVPGFVAQGGGFDVVPRGGPNQTIYSLTTLAPITNEFNVGQFYSNTFGTIAMAKTSDPNSATSQFFFNLADNSSSLDNPANSGGFTVFGHVIAGLPVLNAFNLFSTNASAKTNYINSFRSPFEALPSLVQSTNSDVVTSNLVFTEAFAFQRPQLAMNQMTNGLLHLSWNSSSNLVYHIDLSTNLPPVWHEIGTTNGPGTTLSFSTTNLPVPMKFFRLRLPF